MIRIAVAGVTGVTLLVLGAVAALAYRRRSTPGAWPLIGMMAAGSFWVGTRGIQLLATDIDIILLLADIKWLGITGMPAFWFLFCLSYAGRERFVNWQTLTSLSIVPAIVVGAAIFGPPGLLHSDVEIRRTLGLVVSHTVPGPFHWVGIGYAYLLVLAGIAVLARYLAVDQRRYRTQTALLLVGIVVPSAAGVVSALDLVPFEFTPFLLPVTGVAGLAAIYRYRALDARPVPSHVARKRVVERLDTGVVVVDETGEVVDYNETAGAWLGLDEGAPAVDAVPGYEELDEGGTVTVECRIGDRRRILDVREVSGADLVGSVVTLRDVTDRRRRVQRLSVLNRVLRHNVRNEMNVVQGFAERAGGPQADRVLEAAERVVSLSEEARAAQRLLAAERSHTSEPLLPLVETVVDAVERAFPDVAVELDADASAACYCDPRLDRVLHPLVENAAQHNDADDPTVTVTVEHPTSDWVRVRVADNGPGIPEVERRVLDRSAENDLEHGSGLGLWLAAWGARALGGEIEFEENDPRGSVVTVGVPAADERGDPPDVTVRDYDLGSARDGSRSPSAEERADD